MNIIKLTLNQLLLSNVHVGNISKFLNVKIKPFLLGKKNNTYILNISFTSIQLKLFINILINLISFRQKLLIVKDRDYFNFSSLLKLKNIYYYDKKWIGGSLTNFRRVRRSRKFIKDNNTFNGLGSMRYIPSLVFFFNTNVAKWTLFESINLDIPIASIVSTNSHNIEYVTYPIVGNNQTFESLYLYLYLIRNAVLKGKQKELLKILRIV